MDMYNPNYRREKHKKDKLKFENLDLKNVIKEIYFTAIKKAQKDYQNEIKENKNRFLVTSYNEEQAVQKLNYYIDEIRIKNEDDDCYYRLIKNEILKNSIEFPISIEAQKELLIFELCRHIKEDISHYSLKLEFIEGLSLQIYESNKIHNQFLFFKKFIEEYSDGKIIDNPKELIYLKDIFKTKTDYINIIKSLTNENMISKID